ncbi:corepressor interacting with RBPJ 1 [Ixodes scapularis]
MGKGFNNYMCKKPFHPASRDNIKRAWMAEQRTENEKKKQEELKMQYEKEQDLYKNRSLVSKESKEKLALNFMYEAPPGAKREHQKEDDEPEFRFEWQRKYNAPREDFAKGNSEIRDQPFGIPVRNVRCIKCHKWGHINTDRECPMFNQAGTSASSGVSMDPLELMKQMRDDGLQLKPNALGHRFNSNQANQLFIASDEEDANDPEVAFLKSLSGKQKKKLLMKLNKLAKKQEVKPDKKKRSKDKKKAKKKKKHGSKKGSSSSDSSDSANGHAFQIY